MLLKIFYPPLMKYKKNPGKWHPTPHDIKIFYVNETIPTPWPPRVPLEPRFALLMPHTCLLHLWALFLPSLTLLPGTCLLAVNAHPSRMPDSRTF